MTIENHLKKRKGLKQVERKWLKEGIKVTHHLSPSLESINQVISSECQELFLDRGLFSLV